MSLELRATIKPKLQDRRHLSKCMIKNLQTKTLRIKAFGTKNLKSVNSYFIPNEYLITVPMLGRKVVTSTQSPMVLVSHMVA